MLPLRVVLRPPAWEPLINTTESTLMHSSKVHEMYQCKSHACARRWFAGRVSRLEAEKRLRWQDTGVFLVRESESAPGEFSVSVRSVKAPHEQTHTGTKTR